MPGLPWLESIQRLTGILGRNPPEQAVLEAGLDALQACFGQRKAAVLLADASGRLRFRTGRGLSHGDREAIEHGLLRPEPDSCPGLAVIPLRHQDERLGQFLFDLPGSGGAEVRQVAETVANLVSLAMAQARRERAMADAVGFSERLIDTANVMVIGLDGRGRVVIFNGRAEQVTGYTREEILGREWFRTMVPRARFPEMRDLLRMYEATGTLPLGTEMPLLGKSGEERLISWRNSVLREPGGKVAILSFGMDITEARRALEALRASEAKFSRIFHLSPDAIDLTRLRDGVSLDVNPSYAKLYGYTPEELLGHSTLPGDLGIWVDKRDRDRHIQELEAQGEVYGFEAPLRRKDGSIFIGSISSALLEIEGERCNLTLTRDITTRKKAEEDLRASEEKFAKTFRLSPDSININRVEDGVFVDANQGFADITGYTREEVIGRSSRPGDLDIWVRQEDRDRLVEALRATGEIRGLEAPFRRKDGTIITGLMSARRLEIGGVPCLVSVTRDITESKRIEHALMETTQRLQLALASGNLGIWDRDLASDTEIWNDRMHEMYGLAPGASPLTCTQWSRTVLHPEDTPRIQAEIGEALAGRRAYDLEFRILRPDGSLRYIKSDGAVLRDASGRAIRVIGINRDRTERVEAEAERQRLLAELHHAEKLESLGSLAGGVAHDMNNVLAAILVTTELLRSGCPEGSLMERSLDIIQHAGNRGRDLVKALTDFARKGLDETALVDLNELLRKEVELLRHTTLQRIQVDLDLDEQLPKIPGAPSELGGAIMNLGVNAVDAMPEGGVLAFRSRRLENGWVELTVSDTGHGMPPQVLKRAMEPFFTTKPSGKGTGLGLARVYGTARAHGGTVDIQSEPGRGTTVTLRLPSPVSGPFPCGTRDGAGAGTATGPWHILVVDDERIILDTLPALLASLGHTTETATHGEEALRRLERSQDFDLVILDHNMPGLSGLDTLVQLRARHPGLPVVLSTGFLDARTEELLAAIPGVRILKKPYASRHLKEVLAEVSQGTRTP